MYIFFYLGIFSLQYLSSNTHRTAFERNMSLSPDQIGLLPPAQQEQILNGPALQPPTGVISNFDNPANGNVLSYSTFGICVFVSVLAVLINTYARFFCIKRAMIEDCKLPKPYIIVCG